MRVALVGWEIDETAAGALSGLGLDIVAYTRWHEGLPYREACGGWVLERCPHRLGGGLENEAASFRDSVASRDATYYGTGSSGYDVIHVLDAFSQPAGAALAEASPQAARIRGGMGSRPLAAAAGSTLILDHPSQLDEAVGEPCSLVPTLSALRRTFGGTTPGAGPPTVAVWIPRTASVDTTDILAALLATRERFPELQARVLGRSPLAVSLRLEVLRHGMAARLVHGPDATPEARWSAGVAASHALILPGSHPAGDPAALCAWALGKPVVSAGTGPAHFLRDALAHMLGGNSRVARILRPATSRALRQLEPPGVAAGWLRVYLDTITAPSAPPAVSRTARLPGGTRSRLQVVAVTSHEAWAGWHVDPRDWGRCAEWLGSEATHASLVLRLMDITAIAFHGQNAHREWDLELGPGERSRAIRCDRAGLSLAAALGVRSPRGVFFPLALAPLVHLPAEDTTGHPTDRSLSVLPRRPV